MSSPSLQPGMLIAGKYRLDRMLGSGAMGCVYAAENTLTGQRVAIKCMHRQIARSPEAFQRFLLEAKASARIRHPNVVDVYDVLAENETFYLVMELLDGEPLSAYLARETTTIPKLIELLLGAMQGVSAAHRHGVVHRDIKPENIFLARDAETDQLLAKVLDFGISKVHGVHEVGITTPGLALGTIMYMSMEQLTGAVDIDGRADVYAFGVILYQAITGRVPYEADNYATLMMRIVTEHPIAVKQLRPDVPEKLGSLVEAAMAKQRDERISTLDAFIGRLAPFAEETSFDRKPVLTSRLPPPNIPRVARPPSLPAKAGNTPFAVAGAPASAQPQRRSRLTAGVAVFALLFLIGAGFGWWMLPRAEPKVVATQPHLVTPASGLERAPPAAPSGETTAPAAPPVELPSGVEAAAPAEPAAEAVEAPAAPRPRERATKPPVKPDCSPNYYFDARGEKHFKPECF